MQLQVSSPTNNERGPRYMEKALAAIHQGNPRHHEFTLLYGSFQGRIALTVKCAGRIRESIIGPIAANYPECLISPVESGGDCAEQCVWSTELELVSELFPILRHSQFEDQLNHNFADPVSSLLRAIKPDDTLSARIEFTCRPASHRRAHTALKAVQILEREFFRRHHSLARYYAKHITGRRWRLSAWLLGVLARQSSMQSHSSLETSPSRTHDREENLQAAAHKLGCHLFETQLRIIVETTADRATEAIERLRLMEGAFGPFTRASLSTFHSNGVYRAQRRSRKAATFLLSHEELATLWHPPTQTASAEKMHNSEFTELEGPPSFHSEKEEGSVVLGQVRFRDDQRQVVLGLEDHRRHIYIVGKTGMGKTNLIQNMIVSDMQSGRGVCLVDPHGDLAESVAGLVPKHRTNDAILFDASDREAVIPFNPLACTDPSRIDQVTSGVVSAFKKLHDSWGPRLEDTLRNAVFAVVEQKGNLMSVMRLLGEKTFREQMVLHIRDDVVRSFWIHEFANWSDNYRTEAVAAIQNKLRPFVSSTVIRNIVNHPGPSINLRQIMDEGKVLIVNLSKGRLGEDNSTLLGAFIVTSIQQAAMTRADIPESERRDFKLYVDEFQNFSTGSFASVLSEARKFRLSLIIAHQYLSQLDEETASAVFGNVGSIIAFQVGSKDAEILSAELGKFSGQMKPENLTGLPKYTAYVRLLINGMPSNPFSMRTHSPQESLDPDRAEIIRRVSQRRFVRQVVASSQMSDV